MQFGVGLVGRLVGFPSFWRVSNDWGREHECITESWLFGCTHLLSLLVYCNWLVSEAWNYAVVWQGIGLLGSWEPQRAAPGPKEARHNLCHFASCWCMEERDVRGIPLDNGAILTQLSFCIGSFLQIATFPLWCCWKELKMKRLFHDFLLLRINESRYKPLQFVVAPPGAV